MNVLQIQILQTLIDDEAMRTIFGWLFAESWKRSCCDKLLGRLTKFSQGIYNLCGSHIAVRI